jgi:pimeloyl-ACP methyl ester carboxylesterase
VLVHGGWLGGWVWKHVTPSLRAAGHEVFAPTLTGLGERSHVATPEVGLDTHIRDIVNLLEYEDLHDVVLIGHSYGGMVITGVADRAAHRLAQLVYVDAFAPDNGQALYDLLPAPAEARRYYQALARSEGDGWRLPLEAQWRTGPADLLPWLNARWTDHPLKCFEEALSLNQPPGAGLPRTFIRCTKNESTGVLFARLAADPSWQVRELATEHAAMVTAPDALSSLLVDIARPARALHASADPRLSIR